VSCVIIVDDDIVVKINSNHFLAGQSGLPQGTISWSTPKGCSVICHFSVQHCGESSESNLQITIYGTKKKIKNKYEVIIHYS